MSKELPGDSFPYHKHCEFCVAKCESPGYSSSDYVMVTNVWNERKNIERAFRKLKRQTKIPVVWLWIDDGSTDGTSEEISRISKFYPDISIWIEKMPKKQKGNISTIGRAYDKIMPKVIGRLESLGIKYFTIQDVDTDPCPNYFERIIWIMDHNPELGACAGNIVGEEKTRESGLPMGVCKVVRWGIIREIDRYWDLSPDTLLNIKALAKGFNLKIFKIPVIQEKPSFGTTKEGVFYQGQLNYYIGRPFIGVLFRALRRFFLRRHGTSMLRGYFTERKRGNWQCTDPDVANFYGSNKSWFWIVWELMRTRGRYS